MKSYKFSDKNKKDRIKELKKSLEPVDAIPLIKFCLDKSKNFSEEKRKGIQKAMHDGFVMAGHLGLERAFLENVVKQEEWIDWRDNHGIRIEDIAPVLQGYFNRIDGDLPKDKIVVLMTQKGSILQKKKHLFEDRFKIEIKDTNEVLKIMSKEDTFKEFYTTLSKKEKESMDKILNT